MNAIHAGVLNRPSTSRSVASTSPRPVGKPGSILNTLSNRFISASAAGVYRDIDNGFSGADSHGNGSPQSTGTLVRPYGGLIPSSTPVKTSPSKKSGPVRYASFGGSGGSVASSHTSARNTWDYYEAPLAEKYGFGKQTAYQEALANTAYRREMNDLRKAGINPSVYYGSHGSSGAEANIYPREQSSGGSSGYGGSGGYSRRSRGGNSGKYVFSGGAYYGIMTAAAAIGTIATKNLGGGMAAAAIAGTAMKAINGFLKK